MKKLILSLTLLLFPILVSAQTFEHDLYFGLRNDSDVIKLQEFLTDQGVYSGPITGNFFSLTLKGVKDFQARESIAPVAGYFGPLTRAKANAILDVQVEASNEQAIAETGLSPTQPEVPKDTNDVVKSLQDQIALILQQVSLLQQQLQVQQQTQKEVSELKTQVAQQTQTIQEQNTTLQQIQQQTAPTPAPTPTPTPAPTPTPTPTPQPTSVVKATSISFDTSIPDSVLGSQNGDVVFKLTNHGPGFIRINHLLFQPLKITGISGTLWVWMHFDGSNQYTLLFKSGESFACHDSACNNNEISPGQSVIIFVREGTASRLIYEEGSITESSTGKNIPFDNLNL